MARNKPKGWVKEPVRHGLAAKGIKTAQVRGVTMAQIRSGHARAKYGLDTSSGSRYQWLREHGYSDADAQAAIFGVGRESGEPGIGVPLRVEDERTPLDVEREEMEYEDMTPEEQAYIDEGEAAQEQAFERGAESALMITGEDTKEELREAVVMSLGTLSQKALEDHMNLMTGPRIHEAARMVKRGEYKRAIGMMREVAGLGPAEVTRRAKLAIKDIERIQGMG